MMKKLTALLLIMSLLALCAVPAFAGSDAPADGYVPKREWRLIHGRGAYKLSQSENYEFDDGKGTNTYNATYSGDKLVQLEYNNQQSDDYWTDTSNLVLSASGHLISGQVHWSYHDPSTGEKWEETITYDGKVWRYSDGEIAEDWRTEYKDIIDNYEPEFKWYNNTVCLLGLPIRDLKPSLTDKWYTIVPVDLTKDAIYTYPMIAGSIYYVGECQVTVKDGQVTTDFSIPEGLCYDKRHCLQWFTSLDDITPEFLNNLNASYTFGQPVSIADDLKGQDVGILFICNQLQYRIPFLYSGQGFATRYYSGQDHVKAAQADMTALLAKIQK